MRKYKKGQYQKLQMKKEFEKLQEVVLQQSEMVEELSGTFRRIARKEEQDMYKLLKELVQWRANVGKMAEGETDTVFARLDTILEEVGVATFHSKQGDCFDGSKHFCVGYAEAVEACGQGVIAKSKVQGYLWKQSVLLEEEVIVYQ